MNEDSSDYEQARASEAKWREMTKISTSYLPQPLVPCPEEDPIPARNCVWASLIGLVLGIVLGALGARLLP